MPRAIHVGILITGDMDALWRLTQTPDLHERWDLRFSAIEYLPKEEGEPQRFRYATRLGFGLAVEGWGESVATRTSDGERTSSLRFGSASPLSIIVEGSGYWKYTQTDAGLDFETGYDYRTRFGVAGRVFDAVVFRPMIGWATAWSFDRLRLWIERDIDPTLSALRSIVHAVSRLTLAGVFLFHGIVPKMILHHPEELRLIEAAGVPAELTRPALTVAGVVEVLVAVVLIVLWRARWPFVVVALGLIGLLTAALVADRTVATDPFNPITFTAALVALCVVGWVSCRDLPTARRCRRKPVRTPRSNKETA